MLGLQNFHIPKTMPFKPIQDIMKPGPRSIHRKLATCRASSQNNEVGVKKFAVVGAGLAGMAVAWNLMAMSIPNNAITVDVYDVVGIGAGASGAAAGLLHPFTTKGKLIWRGQDAFASAMKLISVAEHGMETSGKTRDPFVFRQPILRPAKTPKQAARFKEFQPGVWAGAVMAASHLSTEQARSMVPGIGSNILQEGVDHAALLLQGGLVLEPIKYLQALWTACNMMQVEGGAEVSIRLRRRQIGSLETLDQEEGPYNGIIAAAGAGNGAIKEIGDKLSCTLSQGYSLHLESPQGEAVGHTTLESKKISRSPHNMMESAVTSQEKQIREALGLQVDRSRQTAIAEMPSTEADKMKEKHEGQGNGRQRENGYPEGAPSLLSSTYLAVQGGHNMVVGATKRPGLTPTEALQECGRQVTSNDEIETAKGSLLPEAERMWEPIKDWRIERVSTGVRSLPPRTNEGSIPLAGPLDAHNRWWVIGGLGARGLVYHAWLGEMIAQAALNHDGSHIPEELLRWKS